MEPLCMCMRAPVYDKIAEISSLSLSLSLSPSLCLILRLTILICTLHCKSQKTFGTHSTSDCISYAKQIHSFSTACAN